MQDLLFIALMAILALAAAGLAAGCASLERRP